MSLFSQISFVWSELSEEMKYQVWSEHLEAGGREITYPEFCDLMDAGLLRESLVG